MPVDAIDSSSDDDDDVVEKQGLAFLVNLHDDQSVLSQYYDTRAVSSFAEISAADSDAIGAVYCEGEDYSSCTGVLKDGIRNAFRQFSNAQIYFCRRDPAGNKKISWCSSEEFSEGANMKVNDDSSTENPENDEDDVTPSDDNLVRRNVLRCEETPMKAFFTERRYPHILVVKAEYMNKNQMDQFHNKNMINGLSSSSSSSSSSSNSQLMMNQFHINSKNPNQIMQNYSNFVKDYDLLWSVIEHTWYEHRDKNYTSLKNRSRTSFKNRSSSFKSKILKEGDLLRFNQQTENKDQMILSASDTAMSQDMMSIASPPPKSLKFFEGAHPGDTRNINDSTLTMSTHISSPSQQHFHNGKSISQPLNNDQSGQQSSFSSSSIFQQANINNNTSTSMFSPVPAYAPKSRIIFPSAFPSDQSDGDQSGRKKRRRQSSNNSAPRPPNPSPYNFSEEEGGPAPKRRRNGMFPGEDAYIAAVQMTLENNFSLDDPIVPDDKDL